MNTEKKDLQRQILHEGRAGFELLEQEVVHKEKRREKI
jgi:hypothetical protein